MIKHFDTPAFSLFWENSKLNQHNGVQMYKRIEKSGRKTHELPQLYYASQDILLEMTKSPLVLTVEKRKSSRIFQKYALSHKELSHILHAYGSRKDGTRNVPSGGQKYPLELYVILFESEIFDEPTLAYYNSDTHSISRVCSWNDWNTTKQILGWSEDIMSGTPSFAVICTIISERTTEKYGERGGRFTLLEAGALMQNISLLITDIGLGSVIAGGFQDDPLCKAMNLNKESFWIGWTLFGGLS